MQPFPLVPIETRRHVVGDAVRTRYGVGDVRIDHAAGVPLGLRRSNYAPSSFPVAPTTDWDDQPNIHERERLRRSSGYEDYEDDLPVVVPMERRSTVLLVIGVIAILFVMVCASIVFSGINVTTLLTHNTGAGPH